MISKEEIEKQYALLQNYAAVARVFGVSRQHIHQIVTGYKNTGIRGRKKLYKKYFKPLCETCGKEPSKQFHHKDGNNDNEAPSNLISLCIACHYKAHVNMRGGRGRKQYRACINCKRIFTKARPHTGRGNCYNCLSNIGRNGGVYVPPSPPPTACNICFRKFTDKLRHQARNLCSRCYHRERWAHDPVYRKTKRGYADAYMQRQKQSDPEHYEYIRERQRITYRKYSARKRAEARLAKK